MRKRRLFCDLSPTAYKISTAKCRCFRHIKNAFDFHKISKTKSSQPLDFLIYRHSSLIRRKLGNSDLTLQDNKAVNLSLSAPKVSGILIKPREVFSFWCLVGNCTEKKGYKEGLIIRSENISSGIGGGMCQLTNLIHWLVLHTCLDIVEHHHHDSVDMFPDYGRTIPFGTGTSIMYNYLDYRFKNNTQNTYQLIAYTSEDHLHGEIRSNKPQQVKYHIKAKEECFTKENEVIYRNSKVFRDCIDKKSGNLISSELIKTNHAKVLYDASHLVDDL